LNEFHSVCFWGSGLRTFGLPRADLRAIFFEGPFWVGFREKWGFLVVSWWTKRGEIVVKSWFFCGDKSALKNTPTF
jgi:hypothetical protein